MAIADQSVVVYRKLADWYDRQSAPQLRDRFLVLAADAAFAAGHADEAEAIRLRLLQVSPHHMLKPFGSVAEALRSPDVQSYLNDLRQGYPLPTAASLLESLETGSGGSGLKRPHPTDGDFSLPLSDAEAEEETLKFQPPPEAPAPPPRPMPVKKEAPSPRPAPKPVVSEPYQPIVRNWYPLQPKDETRERQQGPDTGDEAKSGAWVATLLFVIVLGAGLGLAFLTLVRPFLWP